MNNLGSGEDVRLPRFRFQLCGLTQVCVVDRFDLPVRRVCLNGACMSHALICYKRPAATQPLMTLQLHLAVVALKRKLAALGK